MADNDSLAKKFARVLANPESSNTEAHEARTELEILASRGSIYAREVLAQFPVVCPRTEPAMTEVHTETEQPNRYITKYLAQGYSAPLAKILAECDELSEAGRLEGIRLAPIRAERRAALELAFTQHSVPADHQHGYRRTLEVYQQNYSFEEETKVFEGLLVDIEGRYAKQV